MNLPSGGMQTQLLELLPIYEKLENIKVSLITKYTEYEPITNQAKTYTIRKFKNSRMNTLYFFYKSFLQLVKIHKKEPIHVININSYYYNIISPLLMRLIFKIPLFIKPPTDFTTHKKEEFMFKSHSIFARMAYYGWMRFLEKFISRRRKIYVQAINKTVLKDFTRINFPERNIIKIPNGILSSKFSKIIKQETNEKHFGFVGRLLKSKNLRLLFNVFVKYLQKYPDDKLFIYGSGPEEKYISKFIIEHNLAKNLIFRGFEKDKKKIYSNIDVLIHPSLGEGISNVILEAMCSDTLVIASNVLGNRDIIEHNKTGLLFNPFNEEDLLNWLIYYKEHEEKITRFLKNAKNKVISNYNIEVVAFKIIEFLKSKIYVSQ